MKKLIKWVLGLVAVLAILLVLTVLLLPVFFDPNEHKIQIQNAATKQVGREVQLNGPIEWSVFPWIAINLNQVVIANEQGFKGGYLAQVEQVAVRVKLLPLLSKQIKIGEVKLIRPDINLQVASSGTSNWQSLMTTVTTEDSSAEDSSTDLEIKGIGVVDGKLSYTDGSTGMQLLMSEMTFSSDEIKAGAPTGMSLEALLEVPELKLKAEFNSRWQAQQLTEGDGPQFDFTEMKLDGQLNGVPLEIYTPDKFKVDLATDELLINQLSINYSAMQVNTSVKGAQISSDLSLLGEVEVNDFSLTELFSDLGSPLDNKAESQLSGMSGWALNGDRLQLTQMKFELDESMITGDVDIKQLSQLKGQFNLSVNQMNLDNYVPIGTDEPDSREEGASSHSSAMDLGQLTGQIQMGQLQLAGVKMSEITLRVNTQGKNISVEPLNAGFYQGLIKTQMKLKPDNKTAKLHVTHQMQDVQAGGMLADLMGTEYLTGLGQLNADIKIDEPFSDRPFKTAHGTLSYKLSDGDIVGIDVFDIMQKSLSLLNKAEAIKNSDQIRTSFGLMDIQANVTGGILSTQTMKSTSPFFDLNGQVEIDLDQQTIKGTIKPMLTNIPEGVLDRNFEKLLNIRIPVSLRGDLLSPTVSIDLEKLILESQKAKIDEKKEALKEDLFDAILGTKKDQKTEPDESADLAEPAELTDKQKRQAEKDQLKRSLLEGLLGGKKDKDEKKDKDDDSGTH